MTTFKKRLLALIVIFKWLIHSTSKYLFGVHYTAGKRRRYSSKKPAGPPALGHAMFSLREQMLCGAPPPGSAPMMPLARHTAVNSRDMPSQSPSPDAYTHGYQQKNHSHTQTNTLPAPRPANSPRAPVSGPEPS